MDKLRVLDLFSGIGGFALGLERTGGFRTVAFCESSRFKQRILKKHWPSVEYHEDIRTLDGEMYAGIDLICGGFPCKQTSNAAAVHGRRTGLSGPDSRLWYDMLRVIRQARPDRALVENPARDAIAAVQVGLERLDFTVWTFQGNSFACGAARLRRRFFALADRDSTRLARTRASGPSETEARERLAAARRAGLQALPATLRVDDGFPDRLDRVAAIGDSVDPRLAEEIGRRMMS